MLSNSDVLSILFPLSPGTKILIGACEFRLMQPNTLFINCAHGGIVNEAALSDSLQSGIIAGAGADVLSAEPPRNGNPLLKIEHLPNLILTPHVAWASTESPETLAQQLIGKMEAFEAGTPRYLSDILN